MRTQRSLVEEMGLSSLFALFALILLAIIHKSEFCMGGKTSTFIRKKYPGVDMPFDAMFSRLLPAINAPQQVHITQGVHDGRAMVVSWCIVDTRNIMSASSYPYKVGSKRVQFVDDKSGKKKHVEAKGFKYKWYNYTSVYIHHCSLKNLEDTENNYTVGGEYTHRSDVLFCDAPAPGPVPYTFGLIADRGQTKDSNRTLTHYENNPYKGQTVLMVGDLSYSDNHPYHNNRRWDSWGRFVERNVDYQPWIWASGHRGVMRSILHQNL